MQATLNLSPGPPSEQVLRDLSRAPPETYGSALKAVLRILAHLSSRPAARLQLAYLEVYNDTINDLLPRSDGQGRAAGHDLRLRESASEVGLGLGLGLGFGFGLGLGLGIGAEA